MPLSLASPELATSLLYVADPMCSWCWGFSGVLDEVTLELRPELAPRLLLGGLAPDDDAPMPEATRRYVQTAWRAVAARTGATFEHAFWERCQPRRSTWPACRAVLAAGELAGAMYAAIQRAYYLEARDPSDPRTLVALAAELGLDEAAFERALDAEETRRELAAHLAWCARLGVTGFPSLVLQRPGEARVLTRGWVPAPAVRAAFAEHGLLASATPDRP